MNISEAVYYPLTYTRDIAFWMTKCAIRIFAEDVSAHSNKRKSGPFHRRRSSSTGSISVTKLDSQWEMHMYPIIEQVLRKTRLDESVAIGAIVLLEVLHDVCKPALPDDLDDVQQLLRYVLGAYMLAYRILSEDRPVSEGFWKENGFDFTAKHAAKMEDEVRDLITTHIFTIRPTISKIPFLHIPPNTMIRPRHYVDVRANMYADISLRMAARGQTLPNMKGWNRDIPPCHEEMMERLVLIECTRSIVPGLRLADDWEVYEHIYGEEGEVSLPW